MFFLTAASGVPVVERIPTRLDNILTLSLVGILVLVMGIVVVRKVLSDKKTPVAAEVPAAPTASPVAPGSAGKLKLYHTDPKTAAMVMAIVANKLGKPINELRFISIKEVN